MASPGTLWYKCKSVLRMFVRQKRQTGYTTLSFNKHTGLPFFAVVFCKLECNSGGDLDHAIQHGRVRVEMTVLILFFALKWYGCSSIRSGLQCGSPPFFMEAVEWVFMPFPSAWCFDKIELPLSFLSQQKWGCPM